MKFTKITAKIKEENLELFTSHLTDLGAEGFEIGGDYSRLFADGGF